MNPTYRKATSTVNSTVSMSTSLPLLVAETVQTAHIEHKPSAAHDLNPSTAISHVEPVSLSRDSASSSRTHAGIVEDHVTHSNIRFKPRPSRSHKTQHIPLPDLRFEQSYLHSISTATSFSRMAWITLRDQLMMPLAQGVLYNLAVCGWQCWNRGAQLSGSSVGARIRRWWWGVNQWQAPREETA